MATAKQCEALALIATSGGSLAYERPREKVLINGNVVKRLRREGWIETSSAIGGKEKARSYAGLRITRTARLTESGRAALVQKCGRSEFAGARRRRLLGSASLFQQAKSERDLLEKEVDAASKALQHFPRGAMGLTPDSVRATPEWRTANARFQTAFARQRKFNAVFVKRFDKELRDERARLRR